MIREGALRIAIEIEWRYNYFSRFDDMPRAVHPSGKAAPETKDRVFILRKEALLAQKESGPAPSAPEPNPDFPGLSVGLRTSRNHP